MTAAAWALGVATWVALVAMSARRVQVLHGQPQNAAVRVRAVHSDDQRLMWLETWQDRDEPARRDCAAEALHKVGQLIRRGARLMEIRRGTSLRRPMPANGPRSGECPSWSSSLSGGSGGGGHRRAAL